MLDASMWQHAVALGLALVALGWLVRRAAKGRGSKATGPCASCPASRHAVPKKAATPQP